MADKFENFAPYAPSASVLRVLDQHRDHSLANPVTLTILERIGVPPTMASRTLQTLRFLRLVDEEGNHLPAFDSLRRASTDEFPAQFAEVLQAVYLPVFTSVDPAEADDLRLADAFRGFEPAAQRPKMIALFRALCARAGIGDAPKRNRARQQSTPRQRPAPPVGVRSPSPRVETPDLPPPPPRTDYRMVSAVFEQLPQDGRWTSERRTRWLAAMTAAVDLLVQTDDQTAKELGVEARSE